MQTALSALVCRVCDVCRPSTGRTPGAGCGENRTEPAYHPYLTDYVDVHSVFVRSNHEMVTMGATVLAARPRNLIFVPGSIEKFFCSP